VVGFISATQPKEWRKMLAQHGAEAKPTLLKCLACKVHKHGTLHVLRKGIKANGCKFRLVFFRPSSGLNESARKLYLGNQFSGVRQPKHSQKNEKPLDVAILLNGLPRFTAQLRNPFCVRRVVADALNRGVGQCHLVAAPRDPPA
jgi:type I restriction enzyme R subunit